MTNKLRKYVSDITRTRISNLKNTVINIQRIINQTLNEDKRQKNEPIAIKFYKKFKHLNLFDNGKRIFGDTNEVLNTSFFKPFEKNISVAIDKDYLYAGNLVKIYNSHESGNLETCKNIK